MIADHPGFFEDSSLFSFLLLADFNSFHLLGERVGALFCNGSGIYRLVFADSAHGDGFSFITEGELTEGGEHIAFLNTDWLLKADANASSGERTDELRFLLCDYFFRL